MALNYSHEDTHIWLVIINCNDTVSLSKILANRQRDAYKVETHLFGFCLYFVMLHHV